MRIIFFTAHFGFLRNFETTVRTLAERGHEVLLFAERKGKPDERQIADRLALDLTSVSIVDQPRYSSGMWRALARAIRLCIDYLRYLEPSFADTPRLRARAASHLPGWTLKVLSFGIFRGSTGRRWIGTLLKTLERAVPISGAVDAFIEAHKPDVLITTPLLYFGSQQVDLVRTARRRGLPSLLCIGSWDHLTTKGQIHEVPDRVAVWNEIQREEAIRLHQVPMERIKLTGAPGYDRWFGAEPSTNRAAFCSEVGLRSDRPYLLYLASSMFIAPREWEFVDEWLHTLRDCGKIDLNEVGILIRPHPQNAAQWETFDLGRFENVSIWPRHGANPIDSASSANYYDSMYHSHAVIGLNTSGLIESAIIGRPVFTLLRQDLGASQVETIHFQHLLHFHGGLLHVSHDMDRHIADLSSALATESKTDEKSLRFVSGYVRPQGLDTPAATVMADVVEETGSLQPVPRSPRPAWTPALIPLLFPLAIGANVAFALKAGVDAHRVQRRLTRPLRIVRKRARALLVELRDRVRNAIYPPDEPEDH